MKLKLLIMPLLLVLIMSGAIWWIYPSYQEMKIKEAGLSEATAKLAVIKEKNAKAEKLLNAWDSSLEQRSIIEKYIPGQKEEENAISSLNTLVSDSGLSLSDLSISETEKKNVANIREDKAEAEIDAIELIPVAENFNVVLGVVGDYGKIKTLLDKISSLKRFNTVTSLKIDSFKEQAGVLQANAVLNFNYIRRTNSAINPSSKIFLTGVFDIGVADEIMKKLSTDIKITSIGSTGRENPFVK